MKIVREKLDNVPNVQETVAEMPVTMADAKEDSEQNEKRISKDLKDTYDLKDGRAEYIDNTPFIQVNKNRDKKQYDDEYENKFLGEPELFEKLKLKENNSLQDFRDDCRYILDCIKDTYEAVETYQARELVDDLHATFLDLVEEYESKYFGLNSKKYFGLDSKNESLAKPLEEDDSEIEYKKVYYSHKKPDGTGDFEYVEIEEPVHPKDWHLGGRNRKVLSKDEWTKRSNRLKESDDKDIHVFKQVPDESFWGYDTAFEDELYEIVNDYGIVITGNNRFKSIGDKKLIDIINQEYYDDDTEHDYEPLEELEKITGKKYDSRQIRGYTQSEWNDIYYPVETPDSVVDFADAVYLGKYDIYVSEDGEAVEVLHDDSWKGSDRIKEVISETTGYPKESIRIRQFTGYTRSPSYSEEESLKEETEIPINKEEEIEWISKKDYKKDFWTYIYDLIVWSGQSQAEKTVDVLNAIGKKVREDAASTDVDGNLVIYSNNTDDFNRADAIAKRFKLETTLLDNRDGTGYNPNVGKRFEYTIIIPEEIAEISVKEFMRRNPELFK